MRIVKILTPIIVILLFSLPIIAQAQTISLDQAVRSALKTNPELLEQNQQYLISGQRLEQASSGYRPSIDLRLGSGWQDTNSSFRTESSDIELNPLQSSLILTQPIFSGFKTTHDVASNKANYSAERLQTLSTAEQISLKVIQAYLDVLENQESVKLAEHNLEVHDVLFHQIKQRFEKGASDKADMTQVEGRIALANSNHLASLNNLDDAQARFEAIAGFPAASFSRPTVDNALMPNSQEAALQQAIVEHPSILSSRKKIDSANENYEGSRSPYLPKLDLELKGTWDEDNNGVEGTDSQLSALLVLNWNLYQGGSKSAERKIALSEIDQSNSISEKVLRQVTEEIELAYAALNTTTRQKKFREDHVKFSKESRRLYKLQFDSGRRTLLDVLNTENEVYNSSTAFVEADFANLAAKYRILATTGSLLNAVEVNTPWDYEE